MFYFSKLQIFFNLILLGIFPLFYRYYKYCFYNLKEYYLKELENKYDIILVFEKGVEYYVRKKVSYALHHNKFFLVREYFKIKYENYILWVFDETNQQFQYIGHSFCKDEIYENYASQKYNNPKAALTCQDLSFLHERFEQILPLLFTIQMHLDNMILTETKNIIKWSKIMIRIICWSYFLIVSTWATKGLQLTLFRILMQDNFELLNLFEDIL